MRLAGLAGLLLALFSSAFVPRAVAQLPGGRGVVLPLQDRIGEARLAELIETLLTRELGAHAELATAEAVRPVLRALRIRDASDESPDRLGSLAERLGVEWFFLPTLHEASRNRPSQRRDDVAEDSGDSPQLVLSALVFRRGAPEIWWAGLEAATGRDGEGLLGRGGIATLEELAQKVIQDLVAEALAPRQPVRRARLRHGPDGYLRASGAPAAPERVAVIPMDSVARQAPSASADVATAALLATLDDFGFKPLLPGLVRTIRQRTSQGRPGGADRSEWEALAGEGGANWVATGTVETYRRGVGRTPDPWVALSVRFLGAGDGRIGWLDGLERTGSDTGSAFDRGRIYSTGHLTFEMMRSMFGAMSTGSGIGQRTRGE